eukprot:gene4912-biopygen4070
MLSSVPGLGRPEESAPSTTGAIGLPPHPCVHACGARMDMRAGAVPYPPTVHAAPRGTDTVSVSIRTRDSMTVTGTCRSSCTISVTVRSPVIQVQNCKCYL